MNVDIAASAERWLDLRFHNDNGTCLEALRVRPALATLESSIQYCLTEDLLKNVGVGNPGGGLPNSRVGLEAWRAAATKARRSAGTGRGSTTAQQAGPRVWYPLVNKASYAAESAAHGFGALHGWRKLAGNEHRGISAFWSRLADGRFVLPMTGFVQSFNISTSVGMALYHLKMEGLLDHPAHMLPADEQACAMLRWWLRDVRRTCLP